MTEIMIFHLFINCKSKVQPFIKDKVKNKVKIKVKSQKIMDIIKK